MDCNEYRVYKKHIGKVLQSSKSKINECFINCTESTSCSIANYNDYRSICTFLGGDVVEEKSTDLFYLYNATCGRQKLKAHIDCTTDAAAKLSKLLSNNLNRERDNIWVEKRAQLNEIIEADKDRSKRQIIALGIGTAIGSILSMGYNWFTSQKIKAKIKSLNKEFLDFAEYEHDFQKSVTTFEADTLKIYEKLEENIQTSLDELTCDLDILTIYFLQSRSLNNFRRRLDALLRPINEGKRYGNLSPDAINLENLKTLIGKHENLKNTVYIDHPYLVYAVGKIILANAQENEDNIVLHIILSIPVIQEKNLHSVYEVKQTGFQVNNTCYSHSLPKLVYRNETVKNGIIQHNFYELESSCIGDFIMYCEQNIEHKNSNSGNSMVHCLSEELLHECEIVKSSNCKDAIVYSKSGVLIRSMHPVTAILRDIVNNKKTYIWNPQTSKTGVKFFSWKNYTHVQYTAGIAYNAVDYNENIVAATFTNVENWWKILREAKVKLQKTNMTRIITDLRRTITEVNDNHKWFEGTPHQLSKDIIIILTIILTVIVGLLCYIYTARKWKSMFCCKLKSKSYGESIKMSNLRSENSKEEEEEVFIPASEQLNRRSFAVDRRASFRVSWKDPPVENGNDDGKTTEHVEEFTLEDMDTSVGHQSKTGSEMSLYFYTKPLPLSKRRED